jgi:hypothetical protein
VGKPETYTQAFYARDHAGTVVLVGVPNPEMKIELPLLEVFGRGGVLKSSWYGDCLPTRDFPMFIDLYLQGRLDLERFVSETIALASEDFFNFSEPSSRLVRSHGPRSPALANPLGVTFRFRVFSEHEVARLLVPRSRPAFETLRAPCFPVFLHTPHCSARPELQSPPAFSLPFRAFSRSSGSSPLDASTSRGICHRSAHHVPWESTYPREFHPSSYGPRPGFLTRFAAYSSLGLAGLFHPANALRFLPPGISPPKEPRLLFASDVPSCRCSGGCAPASLGSRDPRRTSHPSLGDGASALGRLHGFPPLESPFRRSMVLARTAVEPLLGFPLSKVFPARSIGWLITILPPLCFLRVCSARLPRQSIRVRTSESCSPGRWHCLSRGRRTLLRFLATDSLTIQRRQVLAYWFASGPRLRRRSL